MQFSITPIPSLKDNYIWAITNSQKDLIIVDPGSAEPVFAFIDQHHLTLKGILVTHHHWDHTNGIAEIVVKYPVPVYGSSPNYSHEIKNSNHISLDSFHLELSIIAIPGHTLDHIAYYFDGNLFTGDTLFAAGCGRAFEGTIDELYTSLQKLASLPNETKIYCGHEYTLKNLQFAKLVEPDNEYIDERIKKIKSLRDHHHPSLPSILSEEKLTNPFLRCNLPTVVASAENYVGKKLENELQVFAAIRKWKDEF